MTARRALILLLFFLSGLSALIYQVAWVRQATLVFGVSIYAYSTVLAAFMGGLAVGSYAIRRRADTTAQPLRLYAGLQVGIAGFGLLTPFLLTWLTPFYGALARSFMDQPALIMATRASFSILVLLIPTLLMGATLPVMARAFAVAPGRVGSDVGQLYAIDTLGAALGCALTGLFLLRTLGTQGTVFVAVALNLLAALIALPMRSAEYGMRSDAAIPHSVLRIPLLYALSGFVALGYELVWARVLAIFTLNAVFSYSIMLTVYLIGLTVGGWLGARWLRTRRASLVHFAWLQTALGLAALFTIFIFALLPAMTIEGTFGVTNPSITAFITYEFLLGFLTLLLPTTLLGLLFPVAASLVTQENPGQVGAAIGRLNAFNTAGSVIGSLVVGFGLLPLLGLQVTMLTLAGINLLLGLGVAWGESKQHDKVTRRQDDGSTESSAELTRNLAGVKVPKRRREAYTPTYYHLPTTAFPAIGLVIGVVLMLVRPDGHYLGFRQGVDEHLVFYGEGVETTVAVFDVPEQNFKVSFVNGRIEVPTDPQSMAAFRLLGHLPAILKPDAQRALMLSFGNGVATGSLDTHNIPWIDAVDLWAEQFQAAKIYWKENYNVLKSPRLHTHIEDGRNFLLQTDQRYDIITTDATHPVNTSSWALFTHEFYRSVADHLTPQGVFMQWMPFHSLLESDYQLILRTFQQVFPNATLWYAGASHTLLLATPQPLTTEQLAQAFAAAAQNQILIDDLGDPTTWPDYLVMTAEQLRAYTGPGPLNTDDRAFFLPVNDDTARLMQMVQTAVNSRR